MKPEKKITAVEIYALVFGLFLGLALWKFGNPVILDNKIITPSSPGEFWSEAWPTHWAGWIFLPLALAGAALVFTNRFRWPAARRLWLLPLLWFGWQLVSATRTVDADLTAATLVQFSGCVACYFTGALVLGREAALRWLLVGVLAGFAFCLVRAADQRLVEFPQSHQMLTEGERAGWTNLPPRTVLEFKRDQVIITTNGVDVANPVILKKFAGGRVMGTLVYPNALAGAVLLLWPPALALAFGARKLRPAIRVAAMAVTVLLGGAGFFWTGSKLGWLVALALGGLCLFRLKWPVKIKMTALAFVIIIGLGIFAARFHQYFAAGATSVSARFDYWRAALQTTETHPLTGTGPGTFQGAYAQIKSPEAEMARMAHNDYLEQFSDSGVPGGVFYGAWIVMALVSPGKRIWKSGDTLPRAERGGHVHAGEHPGLAGGPPALRFALFIGLLGWFVQGIGEFSLYIPALAWTAFTLLGCLLAPAEIGSTSMRRPANLPTR
jgi:hypothetical protein